jgi:hypothetical protein
MEGDERVDKGKRRTGKQYYVGDNGVGVWRAGMEVGNFMSDGMGELAC